MSDMKEKKEPDQSLTDEKSVETKKSETASKPEETKNSETQERTAPKRRSGKNADAQSEKGGRRYRGYEVEPIVKRRSKRNRPWFWRTLGISLVLTAVLCLIVVAVLFRSNQQMVNYISDLNDANTMENLLDGHTNILITTTYSNRVDGDDYTTSRYVKKTKSDEYYSYYKTVGTEEDYKEVIRNQKMYRYDEEYVQFYGLLADDYEEVCLADIEGSVYEADSGNIRSQTESGDFIKIEATCEVTDGDVYNVDYGIPVGSSIDQSLTVEKDTLLVVTAVESFEEEEIYSYTVEFDGENKVPQFYKDVKDKQKSRTCTVYYDYGGADETVYTFAIPNDVYFTVLDREGYTTYVDAECEREFTIYQMEIQNAQTDLTLYVKAD